MKERHTPEERARIRADALKMLKEDERPPREEVPAAGGHERRPAAQVARAGGQSRSG